MPMKQCSKCKGTGKVPDNKVGAEMKAKRIRFDLKQSDIATEMGIPVPYLSRLEHDKNIWSRAMMDKYNAAIAALRNGAK